MTFKRWQHGWWLKIFNFVLAWGFYGNCGREFTLHFSSPCKRLLTLTIRNFKRQHTETTIYFRFGQPVKFGRRAWGIDMNSQHVLKLFAWAFRRQLRRFEWEDEGEFEWGPFLYRFQNASHGFCQFLYVFNRSVCIDV